MPVVRLLLVAALAVVALAACGGRSEASKVAGAAKSDHGALSANCTKTGGAARTVYRCELDGVDVADRPVGSLRSSRLVRCYADDDGVISDVTAAMIRGCTGLR